MTETIATPAQRRRANRRSLHGVTAMILAGGRGTRLRPAVADRPKVLAPVQGRPFVTYLLDRLAAASLRRVVLLTGYRAEAVAAVLGTRYAGMHLEYSAEPAPLGTAGAVRHALPHVDTPNVLLLNGDSYGAIDLTALAAHHRHCDADLTLTLARVDDTGRFGQVCLDPDGRVTAFAEKQASGPGWINAGVYLLGRHLIETIPADRPAALEHDAIPAWVRDRKVYGFATAGEFLDIGTPASYAAAAAFFASLTNPDDGSA